MACSHCGRCPDCGDCSVCENCGTCYDCSDCDCPCWDKYGDTGEHVRCDNCGSCKGGCEACTCHEDDCECSECQEEEEEEQRESVCFTDCNGLTEAGNYCNHKNPNRGFVCWRAKGHDGPHRACHTTKHRLCDDWGLEEDESGEELERTDESGAKPCRDECTLWDGPHKGTRRCLKRSPNQSWVCTLIPGHGGLHRACRTGEHASLCPDWSDLDSEMAASDRGAADEAIKMVKAAKLDILPTYGGKEGT